MICLFFFRKRDLGGGTIHDLGIYTLQLTQLIFGKNYEQITAVGNLNSEGVDDFVTVVIKYSGGKMAILTTNSRVSGSNVAEIIGPKGYIQVNKISILVKHQTGDFYFSCLFFGVQIN